MTEELRQVRAEGSRSQGNEELGPGKPMRRSNGIGAHVWAVMRPQAARTAEP